MLFPDIMNAVQWIQGLLCSSIWFLASNAYNGSITGLEPYSVEHKSLGNTAFSNVCVMICVMSAFYPDSRQRCAVVTSILPDRFYTFPYPLDSLQIGIMYCLNIYKCN